MTDTGRLNLPFGVAAGGRQIGWNIRPKGAGVAHALIYGPTGRGKTEALMTLAGKAMDRGHLVYVADPKADDFEEWKDQHICPVATEPDSITAMVARVRRERERRVRDIRKGRRMVMLASGELPSILLVVDEMQSLLSMVGWTPRKPVPAMDDLLNLAQQGRSAGIHLAVGTQHPKVDDVGGGSFRNQLEMVIALGDLSSEARRLTGIKAELTAHYPGRGIVSWPGHEVEVQVGLSGSRIGSSPELLRGPRVAAVHDGGRDVLACMDAPVDQPVDTVVDGPVDRGSPILPPVDEATVARIRELHAAGHSIRRIVDLLAGEGRSVSRGAVHNYARQAPAGEAK